MDAKKKLELTELVLKNANFIEAEGDVIKNESTGTYGIVFKGQTLKVNLDIEPVFDMTDKEMEDLLTLIAVGVPLMATLLSENARLENHVHYLLDALQKVLEIMNDVGKETKLSISIIEDSPTVGEK